MECEGDQLYKLSFSEHYYRYLEQLENLVENKIESYKGDEKEKLLSNFINLKNKIAQALKDILFDIIQGKKNQTKFLYIEIRNISYLIVRKNNIGKLILNHINKKLAESFTKLTFDVNDNLSKLVKEYISILNLPKAFFMLEDTHKSLYCLPAHSSLFQDDIALEDNQCVFSKFDQINENSKSPVVYINDNEDLLGFSRGNLFWSLDTSYLEKSFDKNPQSKWIYLKEYLTQKDKKNKKQPNEILDFVKNDDFNYIYSKLIDNFYLEESPTISSENIKLSKFIKSSFERTLLTSKISNYDNHKFITSYPSKVGGTVVGIYNSNKNGESKPNLEYWLSSNSSEHTHFPKKEKANSKEVYVLKPEYSFYFKEFFFEDYLEIIFRELKSEGIVQDFISNVKFNGQEFDFFIFTPQNKIIKVEAKTTINQFNIDTQKEKDENFILVDEELDLVDKYLLLGYRYSKKCKTKYHYFIKNEDEGLDFELPLYNSSEKKLVCISLPGYVNMKKTITRELNE